MTNNGFSRFLRLIERPRRRVPLDPAGAPTIMRRSCMKKRSRWCRSFGELPARPPT